jgi:dodecin
VSRTCSRRAASPQFGGIAMQAACRRPEQRRCHPRSGTGRSTMRGRVTQEQSIMSIAKVIEITSESSSSFEDAIEQGIAKAAETVHNLRGAWIKEQQVLIDNNKIVGYRVDLKLTFVVD